MASSRKSNAVGDWDENESSGESSYSQIYKNSYVNKHQSSLHIIVPKGKEEDKFMEEKSTLGTPPEINGTEQSDYSIDKITQVPTPIINNGSFGFSPQSLPSLEIKKRRGADRAVDNSSRFVSEYHPALTSSQKLEEVLEAKNEKRFVSSPGKENIIDRDSGELKDTNTTELTELSKYYGRMFTLEKLETTYKFEREIGKGNFSKVILARNVNDLNDLVSIKIVSVPSEKTAEVFNFRSYIKRELNILYHLNHPCIIHLLGYSLSLNISNYEVEQETSLYNESESEDDKSFHAKALGTSGNRDQQIFLNYCPGGNLLQFLTVSFSRYSFSDNFWSLIKRIVSELLVAIAYIHSENVIHRDIKLENVLLNFPDNQENTAFDKFEFSKAVINLTDFGLSKKLKSADQLLSTRCGSQDYIPPEILLGLKYNGKLTDSWSLGVLIYAILENRLPFDPPPMGSYNGAIVSPSVMRRKRTKHNVAHRIAMIDWDWFSVQSFLESPKLSDDSKLTITNLKNLAAELLVRKDRRLTPEIILTKEKYHWVRNSVPISFYSAFSFKNST